MNLIAQEHRKVPSAPAACPNSTRGSRGAGRRSLLALLAVTLTVFAAALAPEPAAAASALWASTTTIGWSSGSSWDGGSAPAFNNTLDVYFYKSTTTKFDNNLGTADKLIRSLNFNADADTSFIIYLSSANSSGGGTARTLTFDTDSGSAAITVDSGAVGSFTIGAGNGGVTLVDNLVVTHNGSGELRIDRPISGAGGITKNGTGRLFLRQSNLYTGPTTINAGVVCTGGNTGGFGDATTSGPMSLNGGTIANSSSTSRPVYNNVTMGGDITIGGHPSYGAGLLAFSGTFNLGGATRGLTINSPVTLSGIVSAGGLTKLGADTLTLSAVNTYSGATTISAGTLLVDGSTHADSAVTVAGAGTLGGTGTVNGPVTVNGTLSAGTSVGKLTTGALTLNGGATNVWEISSATGTAGTDWDLVDAGANNVDVQATSAHPFTFKLVSTALNNFDKDTDYSWSVIAGTALNFAANKFVISEAGFTNDLAGGYFSIESGSLKLKFTRNRAPTASPVNYSFARGVSFKPFNIPISTFLAANTADADNDARELVSLTSTNATISTNASPGNITLSSTNGLPESIAYVVKDVRNYRTGDLVRYATNFISILRTNSTGPVSISNTGGTNMTLRFFGMPNYQYVIQRSPDLSAWTDVVTNAAAANGLIEYVEAPPYNPAYYRIRTE